ncbi:MAG: short-chain fatty acid transporter [Acidobacteria bacterium]|nr:MAG: short-chain fatty acid transporter [Acidobacteriota bacterium]REK09265.1 MAG: short-chain fatty acid transporter [Acidobacteriota bacterium]
MSRLAQFLARFFVRWIPDSFVVAVLLSLLTFGLAVLVAGYGASETIDAWGDGFWDLLKFTNQITLTLLLGYVLAHTPPMRWLLQRIAGAIRTPFWAYAGSCLVTGVCALVSWGLSLIVAGIMARAVGESFSRRGIALHYPLLVASSFSGFVIWHQGLSSSIGLVIATPDHFLQQTIGVIPTSETIFTAWNLGVALFVLATLPFVMASLAPRDDAAIEAMPEELVRESEVRREPASTPAERLGESRLLMALFVLCGLVYMHTHFVERGLGNTLDIFNFCFLIGGILMAGSLIGYVRIMISGGRVAVPFLLQYPMYSGIAAVMGASGLAALVIEAFVSVSSAETLPLFAFLSGGLLNLFIPSGGGQWAVQGPIMMQAAVEVGATLPRTAMAVAFGDQWTNLIQPLAVVPVLAIAGIELRKIMAYCLIALGYTGIVFAAALALF